MRLKNGLFFVLFGLLPGIGYQTIQDKWRVALAQSTDLVVYFLGVAPNFLGALSLASSLIIIADQFMRSIVFHRRVNYVMLTSLVGLLTWEILQIWLPNGTFDVHDLGWTLIGVIVAWVAARVWFKVEWHSEPDAEY